MIFTAFLLGCGGLDNSLATDEGREADSADIAPGTLRVDVTPAAADDLLPQSFVYPPGFYEGITLDHTLAATVTVYGTLTADTVLGWNSAVSASGPLSAVVHAGRTGLVQGGVAQTDELGNLSLALPGNQAYTLDIVPVVATASPATSWVGALVSSADAALPGLDLGSAVGVLGTGAPVYGRVSDEVGVPVAYAPLHLRRVGTELQSASFTADKSGWFVVRAEPGYDYVLETEGSNTLAGGPLPTVGVTFPVEDEAGAEVAINVGDRTPVTLTIKKVVGGDDSRGVSRPRIRATSSALGVEGSLVVETSGQDDGRVSVDLLPGTWTIEVWPGDDDAELTPWTVTDFVVREDTDLGTVTLAAATALSGVVLESSGIPAANVTVTATELGYGAYTFSTNTDPNGRYTLSVPRAALRLDAIPANSAAGAYTHIPLDLADAGEAVSAEIDLALGSTITGVAELDGTPLAFAFVEVWDHAGGLLLARTLTDNDGHYSVQVNLPDPDASDTGDSTGDTGGNDTGAADTGS